MTLVISLWGGSLNVKCKYCGKLIQRENAYKVVKGNVNNYYCSETEYNNMLSAKLAEQKNKEKMYSLINDIIGKTTNTILFKEIKIWLSVTNYSNIVSYLIDNKQFLVDTMQKKNFANDYGMIRYFSAIVKNNIGDYKPPTPEIIRKIDIEIYDTKFKPKTRRKCLTDYEDGE